MPVAIRTNRTKSLTTIRVHGVVRLPELISALNTYGAEGPTRYEIYDIRNLTGERLSSDDISSLTEYFNRYSPQQRPPGSRSAIVVASDVDYGIGRMIALMTEDHVPFEVEIFHSLQAAQDWLDTE